MFEGQMVEWSHCWMLAWLQQLMCMSQVQRKPGKNRNTHEQHMSRGFTNPVYVYALPQYYGATETADFQVRWKSPFVLSWLPNLQFAWLRFSMFFCRGLPVVHPIRCTFEAKKQLDTLPIWTLAKLGTLRGHWRRWAKQSNRKKASVMSTTKGSPSVPWKKMEEFGENVSFCQFEIG